MITSQLLPNARILAYRSPDITLKCVERRILTLTEITNSAIMTSQTVVSLQKIFFLCGQSSKLVLKELPHAAYAMAKATLEIGHKNTGEDMRIWQTRKLFSFVPAYKHKGAHSRLFTRLKLRNPCSEFTALEGIQA